MTPAAPHGRCRRTGQRAARPPLATASCGCGRSDRAAADGGSGWSSEMRVGNLGVF
ncbi:hypothetical protein FTUN_6161 [Frigoriglobus tundricola]|uniref:Uncharacterized protein n=1 Tax=Frigoriglobus tundricola TaxID=2774151 RepID=A0A6M5YYN8_9BACT|nr:hypothetical protein FTUN_6161 [Frigoriglobus tundricola]